MMGDNRELRIDKIDLWKGEVREKLEKAIEKAMLNAALSEAEGDEIEFSQKVNSMGSEVEKAQTVVISQFTTSEDITEELTTQISRGLCVSSYIKITEDRLMEGTAEIEKERGEEKHRHEGEATGKAPMTQLEADIEMWDSSSNRTRILRGTSVQGSVEIEDDDDMGKSISESQKDMNKQDSHRREIKKWKQAQEFMLKLEDDGEVRGCYRRLGPVIFDVTGEFIEFIEGKLKAAKRETENTENTPNSKIKKEISALSKVLSATTKALDTIMKWESNRRSLKDWEAIYLINGYETIEEAHRQVQEEEKRKEDKRQRDLEESIKNTAVMTRQIHAHLGLGTIRDEAALAQRKIEVVKENRKIVLEEQKKRDVKALEAERKVQEQKMTWAQRAVGTAPTGPLQVTRKPMTLDGVTPVVPTPPIPLAQRKETKIVMDVKIAYPGPGTAWVGMKERLRGEITAAFQAFNNAAKELRLPTIKEIERVEGNPYERLLTFEGSAESAGATRILQNLEAYFTAQNREYFKRAWEYQPWATSLVIYGLPAREFPSIVELDLRLRSENKELGWGERKARRLVGRAAEHGKPPVKIEFKTAAEAKTAMLKIQLGGQGLNVKKYYDRATNLNTKIDVPGAPKGPKTMVQVQVPGTPPIDKKYSEEEERWWNTIPLRDRRVSRDGKRYAQSTIQDNWKDWKEGRGPRPNVYGRINTFHNRYSYQRGGTGGYRQGNRPKYTSDTDGWRTATARRTQTSGNDNRRASALHNHHG